MKNSHLTLEGARRILEDGFEGEDERIEIFSHLATACRVCRRLLGGLAGALVQQGRWAIVRPGESDAVVWALRREAEQGWQGEAALEGLRPVHRHWARRVATVPVAFGRLVLEESLEKGLDQPAAAVAVMEETRRGLEAVAREAEAHPERWFDLRFLGRLYEADAWRECGEGERAERLLTEAWALGSGPGTDRNRWVEGKAQGGTASVPLVKVKDREILLTAFEIEAQRDWDQGLVWRALSRLERAREWLEEGLDSWGGTVPGRRSEHYLFRARLLLRHRRHAEAWEALILARTALPEVATPRLELDITHHMAALEFQEGKMAEAYVRLVNSQGLYQDHGSDWILAQRSWLMGRLDVSLKAPALAQRRLRQAFQEFLRLGRDVEAVYVLVDLLRCSVHLEYPAEEFLSLRLDLQRLLRSSACRQVTKDAMEQLLKRADEEGLSLSILEEWEEGPPIH